MVNAADILNARILVVDDNAVNIQLIERALRGAGYAAIESTTDPNLVCEMYKRNSYGLVLLDLQMPGLDGFGVMEQLREVAGENYLPVVVTTAEPGHKLRALTAGAKDFVTKPFDLVELRARVRNILEISLLRTELAKYSALQSD